MLSGSIPQFLRKLRRPHYHAYPGPQESPPHTQRYCSQKVTSGCILTKTSRSAAGLPQATIPAERTVLLYAAATLSRARLPPARDRAHSSTLQKERVDEAKIIFGS